MGLTGFYMLYRLDLWDRFRHGAYWWIEAMIAVWLFFTLNMPACWPLKACLQTSAPVPRSGAV